MASLAGSISATCTTTPELWYDSESLLDNALEVAFGCDPVALLVPEGNRRSLLGLSLSLSHSSSEAVKGSLTFLLALAMPPRGLFKVEVSKRENQMRHRQIGNQIENRI